MSLARLAFLALRPLDQASVISGTFILRQQSFAALDSRILEDRCVYPPSACGAQAPEVDRGHVGADEGTYVNRRPLRAGVLEL